VVKEHSKKQANYHDTGYKELFSYPEMIQALVEGFLPAEMAAMMDFDSLKAHPGHYVTPLFDEKIEDLVWSVKVNVDGAYHIIYLYILLEFQSSVDQTMALRFLHYVAAFYSTLIKQGSIKKTDLFPPVLPLVIYNGSKPWTAKININDHIEAVPLFLKPFQPMLEYFLLDEGRYSDEALEQINNPLSGIITLENAKTQEEYQQAIYRMGKILRSHPKQERIDKILTLWFKRHLQNKDVSTTINSIMETTGEQGMLAENLDNLFTQIEQKGIQKGMLEGEQKGMLEGEQKGMLEGEQKGMLEGKLEAGLTMIREFNLSVKEVAEKLSLPLKELKDRLKQDSQ